MYRINNPSDEPLEDGVEKVTLFSRALDEIRCVGRGFKELGSFILQGSKEIRNYAAEDWNHLSKEIKDDFGSWGNFCKFILKAGSLLIFSAAAIIFSTIYIGIYLWPALIAIIFLYRLGGGSLLEGESWAPVYILLVLLTFFSLFCEVLKSI